MIPGSYNFVDLYFKLNEPMILVYFLPYLRFSRSFDNINSLLIRLSVVVSLFTLASCDPLDTGELCNHREDSVNLLMRPVFPGTFGHDINNGDLIVNQYDSTLNQGYYTLLPGRCVFMGQERTFSPIIDYLEIHTDSDTIIYNSNEEIRKEFKKSGKRTYLFILD